MIKLPASIEQLHDAMPVNPDDFRNFSFDQSTVRENLEAVVALAAVIGVAAADEEAFLAAYDQGDVEGICDGMSLAWIAAKLLDSLAGKSGPRATRRDRLTEPEYLRAATRAQTFWQAQGRGLQTPARALGEGRPLAGEGATSLPERACELTYQVILTSPDGGTDLLENAFAARIVRLKGSATQLTFPVGEGRHSVAMYRSHGSKVYVFDANHGEYQVRESLLVRWLVAFLDQKYAAADPRLASADGQPQIAKGWILRRWYYPETVKRRPLRGYGAPRDLEPRVV